MDLHRYVLVPEEITPIYLKKLPEQRRNYIIVVRLQPGQVIVLSQQLTQAQAWMETAYYTAI